MERENNINTKMLRYIYILNIDNLNKSSRFYGKKTIYYVGQTNNILRRFREHFHHKNSKFLSYNFPNARRVLIYVEYLYGTEYDAMGREIELKKLSRTNKEKLIKSVNNRLIKYEPGKWFRLIDYKKDINTNLYYL